MLETPLGVNLFIPCLNKDKKLKKKKTEGKIELDMF